MSTRTPAPKGVVVFVYDDAIEPSREGAVHEKLLRAHPSLDDAAADDVAALMSFAIASRSIANGFGIDAADADAAAAADASSSSPSSPSGFCVAKTSRARVATLDIERGGAVAGARLDVDAFPDVACTDRDVARALEGVKDAYTRAMTRDGASVARDDEDARDAATREAVERGVADFARLASPTSCGDDDVNDDDDDAANANASVQGAFESHAVFYAVERVGEEACALDLRRVRGASSTQSRAAESSSSLDARTASTLARVRRDVERDGRDGVKHVFVKPAHEAWVCASASDGSRAYVVVEDSSDTLLRAVRQAKTFAEAKFPAIANAYDVA